VEGPKGACKGEKSGPGGGSLGERIQDGKGLAERKVKGRASLREPRRESRPRVLPVREVAMEGANNWRFVPLGEGRHAYPHCKGRPYRWNRVGGGLVGHDKGGGWAGAILLAHGKGNDRNRYLRARSRIPRNEGRGEI